MAGETKIPVIGNLTADPEMRMTNGNVPVVNFTVASTPSRFDKSTNQWVDGVANFFNVKVFGAQAEHIARSLTKGMRVMVFGSVETETWVDQASGQNRSKQVINADEVGPSLKFGTIAGFQRSQANVQGAPQVAQAAQQPVMQTAPQVMQAAPQVAQQPVMQAAPQVAQAAPQVVQAAPQVAQAAPQVVQTSAGPAGVQF